MPGSETPACWASKCLSVSFVSFCSIFREQADMGRRMRADELLGAAPRMSFSFLCGFLIEILEGLFQDWGAFLDASLYLEALIHFLGGEAMVCRKLP